MHDPWSERRFAQEPARPGDPRTPFERDRARVIHAAAFRRLQAKTQILGVQEGDFHRTRLTHSMEVAQIGRGMVMVLRQRHPELQGILPVPELIETVGLSHDLGHPPFGHGGEVALNACMLDHGGFEGNGQTLRLLTRLEAHTPGFGLNLTRRALLGVLKYPVLYSQVCRRDWPERPIPPRQLPRHTWQPPKCILDTEQEVLDWILEPLSLKDRERLSQNVPPGKESHGRSLHKSLDASLMELADDIAYGIHDFEDGLALRLLDEGHLREVWRHAEEAWLRTHGLDVEEMTRQMLSGSSGRKQGVGTLVNALVTSITLEQHPEFEEPLLAWSASLPEPAFRLLKAFKETVARHVICLNTVQAATFRGHQIVTALFEAFASDPELLLPEDFRSAWQAARSVPCDAARVLCDYVSGMTDQYANRTYERLFIPGRGSVFDRT